MIKFLSIVLVFLNPFISIAHPDIKTDELSQKLTIFFNSIKPSIESLSTGEADFKISIAKLPLIESQKPKIIPESAGLTANFLIAASGQTNPNFKPIRDWSIEEPKIEAKAALIINEETDKILYQKNADQVLPIASLTKLMTALIVLENTDLEQNVIISKKAIEAYGDLGGLKVNEKISVKNLLYIMLMESSNDAAAALAEALPANNVILSDNEESRTNAPRDPSASPQDNGLSNFIFLMNQKADELGLKNTHFTDPTGYNPSNVSTALDLAELIKYSLSKPLLWDILKTPVIDLSSSDGKTNHHLINNNQLLNRLPEMIAGKTGYTEDANGCMIALLKAPDRTNLINIVLGAKNRFLETEKLANWVKEAYIW